MAYTTIDDPSAQFQNKIFTGNATARALTFDGNSDLQPDLVWAKNRDDADGHILTNSTRGTGLYLACDSAAAEVTSSVMFTAFGSDGFSVSTAVNVNSNTEKIVVWGWKANGGTTATNTTGNNIDSVIQANTTAGFSIITYDGNGTQSGDTVGHGLGAVPKMIISKDRDATSNVATWRVYHASLGNTKYLTLDNNEGAGTFTDWDDTTPTSTVYSVGGSGGYTPTNTSSTEYISYAFAEVQGYSRISAYTGNGNASGPFVWCGFQPAWVLIKQSTNNTGDGWHLIDNTRDPSNRVAGGSYHKLFPDVTNAESASVAIGIDLLSNGFKVRATDGGLNADTKIYCFIAFAHHPFVTSDDGGSIPTTAR